MVRTILIAGGLLWAGTAFAEDVIIERDAPPPAASSKTTVEKHGPDCDSKSVHKEDEAGSTTVTREDCD